MESKKRKRESDPPRITYHAPSRTFDRLFNEESLEETKQVVRRKLRLHKGVTVQLAQLRDGLTIDLEDDDDFEAFHAVARNSLCVDVRVTILQPENAPEVREKPPEKSIPKDANSSSTPAQAPKPPSDAATAISQAAAPVVPPSDDNSNAFEETGIDFERAPGSSRNTATRQNLENARQLEEDISNVSPSHVEQVHESTVSTAGEGAPDTSVSVPNPRNAGGKNATNMAEPPFKKPPRKKRHKKDGKITEGPTGAQVEKPPAKTRKTPKRSAPEKSTESITEDANVPQAESPPAKSRKTPKKSALEKGNQNNAEAISPKESDLSFAEQFVQAFNTAGDAVRKRMKGKAPKGKNEATTEQDSALSRKRRRSESIPEVDAVAVKPAQKRKKLEAADMEVNAPVKEKKVKEKKKDKQKDSEAVAACVQAAVSKVFAAKGVPPTVSTSEPDNLVEGSLVSEGATTRGVSEGVSQQVENSIFSKPGLPDVVKDSIDQAMAQEDTLTAELKDRGGDASTSNQLPVGRQTQLSSIGMEASSNTGENICPVCLQSTLHARPKCPVVLAGSESIERRLHELRNEQSSGHIQVIQELEDLLENAREKESAKETHRSRPLKPPMVLSTSNARKAPPEPPISSATAADTTKSKAASSPPVTTQTPASSAKFPRGSLPSEVEVQSRDEGSSDEESDESSSEHSGVNRQDDVATATKPRNNSPKRPHYALFADVDMDSIIRGPLKSRPSLADVLAENAKEDEEFDDEGVVDDDEEEFTRRRHSKKLQRVSSPSESDIANSEIEDISEDEDIAGSPGWTKRFQTPDQISFAAVNDRGESMEFDGTADAAFSEVFAADNALFNLAEAEVAKDTTQPSDKDSPIALPFGNIKSRSQRSEVISRQTSTETVAVLPSSDGSLTKVKTYSGVAVIDVPSSKPRSKSKHLQDININDPIEPAEEQEEQEVFDSIIKPPFTRKSGRPQHNPLPAPVEPSVVKETEKAARRVASAVPSSKPKVVVSKKGGDLIEKSEMDGAKEKTPRSAKKIESMRGREPKVASQDDSNKKATASSKKSVPETPISTARSHLGVNSPKLKSPLTEQPRLSTLRPLDQWTTLAPTSPSSNVGALDELQPSSPEVLRQKKRNQQTGLSERKGNGSRPNPLFLYSESQTAFPYSQWNSIGHQERPVKSSSSSSESEPDDQPPVPKPWMRSAATSYPGLTELSSQKLFTSPSQTPAAAIGSRSMGAIAKDKEADSDDEESSSSSSSGDSDQPSHIPKKRIAGAKVEPKYRGKLLNR